VSCQNCTGCNCDRNTSISPSAGVPKIDSLTDIFSRQMEFMDMLVMADKLPEYPIDITTKYGQRQIKEIVWNMVEEMAEASFILKNRAHRFTDHTDVDFEHFKEELGDALAYFVEICVMSGITPEELYAEYCRKNAFVKKRARDGY
jgi:NTP pyrophosphatase (non-canonical NTP hydrolase)